MSERPSLSRSLSVQLMELVNSLPAAPVLLVPANEPAANDPAANLNAKSRSKTSEDSKPYCKEADCPLNIKKIQHHTGTYFHPRLRHSRNYSLFSHCSPPVFIWEAFRRLAEYRMAKSVLETEMEHKSFDAAILKEKTTVVKFLEYHGGIGGSGNVFFNDMRPGARTGAHIGRIQFPTRASDSPAIRLENMARRLSDLSNLDLDAGQLGVPNSPDHDSSNDYAMATIRQLRETINGVTNRPAPSDHPHFGPFQPFHR